VEKETGGRFTIESSAESGATPERILDIIKRPATWPSWQSEIVSTTGPRVLEREGDVVIGRAEMLGFKVDGQSVATTIEPRRFVEDVVVGVGMTVTYDVAPSGDGATVTHRLTSQLPRGALGRVLSFFLKRRFRKMQRDLLRALVAQAEEPAG